MSTLTKRIITALILAGGVLSLLFFAPLVYISVFLSVALLIAMSEWAGFAGWSGVVAKFIYTLFGLGAMLLIYQSSAPELLLFAGLLIAVSVWTLALVGLLLWTGQIARPIVVVTGFLFLLPAWMSAERIILSEESGAVLLFLLFWIVAAADIGAYFSGKTLGKHKLLPRVSPGKTIEGFVGGLICATLAACLGAVLLDWPVSQAMLIGVSIGAVSVLGDLTVSLFKRNANLKDSGSILPGHGGVLDRIDGVIAAMPLYVAMLWVFGKLPAIVAV